MSKDKYDANLRGTLKDAFSVGGVDIDSTVVGDIGVPIDKFWNHGLGSIGVVKDHGDITSGLNLNCAYYGLFQRMRLVSGTSFVFSNSLPLASASGWIIVDNISGGTVTPTWPGHFEFGRAGQPTIPNNTVCTIFTAYDYEGGTFRCTHNCVAPAITFTDTGITITGGAKAGAVLSTGVVNNTVDSICTGTYDYSTADSWQLLVYPIPTSGVFELDVRKRTWGNVLPAIGDSICASALPSLTGNGTDFTASGATSTWTAAPINRGDILSIAPTTNTAGVKWWSLYIPARRTF